MKAVILAGGKGTRISEESYLKPKPMIEIGGRPILWHILKMYSAHGINDFIICCGYKGYVIKEYFSNYFLHMSNVTFDIAQNSMEVHEQNAEPWRVTLIDTGEDTMTGGRLKRVSDHVKEEDAFCLTYGDGVGDIDITASIAFHERHGKLATMTTTIPSGRFGAVKVESGKIVCFEEKPIGDGGLINGGFFVFSPKVMSYLDGDHSVLERDPLQRLSEAGELMAWKHEGFWQPMDTMREKEQLEELWQTGQAPWKQWD